MGYVIQERLRTEQTWHTMQLADKDCEMLEVNAENAASNAMFKRD